MAELVDKPREEESKKKKRRGTAQQAQQGQHGQQAQQGQRARRPASSGVTMSMAAAAEFLGLELDEEEGGIT